MPLTDLPDGLLPWAMTALSLAPKQGLEVLPVSGDASSRRYFRLRWASTSRVLVHAPPATEKNAAFVEIAGMLSAGGIRVPAVITADLDRGFLLLEDLGDQLLLPLLDAGSVGEHYGRAFALLEAMADLPVVGSGLGPYDHALLSEELGRFGEWFVQALLGHMPGEGERALLESLFRRLLDSALAQPVVFVHRDFHSRNLMCMADGELALIDFQDAVVGPVTYDLVSLLRDCYIRWPREQVCDWALAYRDRRVAAGRLAAVDDATFLRWFDWLGLQRHIKVLGTFARLYLRDGKAAYLRDLPLVIDYVLEITALYANDEPAFADFHAWFVDTLVPRIKQQAWSTAS